jgi:hypothetical protein
MKWLIEPAAVALGIIIVIVAIILFGGFYLRATQQPLVTPTPVPLPTMVTGIATPVPTTVPETTPPTPEITAAPTPTPRGTFAKSATPIRDPSIYNAPDFRTVYNLKGRAFPTIFHQTYEGKFQYEAISAEVVNPPFIIDYAVTPGSSSPVRSFFIITVWDNTTHKVLAQDGYFRTYSAESPKRLYFSFPGKFYIEMHGGFVTADLTLRAPP